MLLNPGAGTPTLFNFSSFVSQFNLELLKVKLIFALSTVLFVLSPVNLEVQCSPPSPGGGGGRWGWKGEEEGLQDPPMPAEVRRTSIWELLE